jgi:hypothetical protein
LVGLHWRRCPLNYTAKLGLVLNFGLSFGVEKEKGDLVDGEGVDQQSNFGVELFLLLRDLLLAKFNRRKLYLLHGVINQ